MTLIYTEDFDARDRQAIAARRPELLRTGRSAVWDRMCGVAEQLGYNLLIGTHVQDTSKEELEDLGEPR